MAKRVCEVQCRIRKMITCIEVERACFGEIKKPWNV
jgi:hypothetical protein